MAKAYKGFSNRNKVYTVSPSTPEKFSPPIAWFSPVGAGNVVLKGEDGVSATYTVTGAEGGIVGPFLELTSFTCTRVLMGDGAPPSPPVSGAVSTAGSQGTVQLSTAPASAATPIAVGTNDVRVTVEEVAFTLSGSNGALTEMPLPFPPVACTLTSAKIVMGAAITQNDTNYVTLTLAKRDGAGGAATTIVAPTTQVTGGKAFAAFQVVDMGTLSNASVLATDQLTLKSVATASGQASGAGKIRLTFTVP